MFGLTDPAQRPQVFNGDVKLVIYRIKHVEVDGHFGTLLTLEEAPKSR